MNTLTKIGSIGTVAMLLASGGVARAANWVTTGNSLVSTDYLGSSNNQSVVFKANAAQALKLVPGTVPSLIGGYSGNTVTAGVVAGVVAGGGASTTVNSVTDDYGFVGGGISNQAGNAAGTTSDASYSVVCGGRSNLATGAASVIGGGDHNSVSQYDSFIGGGAYNVCSGIVAVVGGGGNNQATGTEAVVGGGDSNLASGDYSFVGGGQGNQAISAHSSILGGYYNIIGAAYATVAGGFTNSATGEASFAAGSSNIASGNDSTVFGGGNRASGFASIVAGGLNNYATGDASFAAGDFAKADYSGCFVWSDASASSYTTCGAANKFVARSSGGVVFYTNSAATLGASLAANATSWGVVSDRNAKKDIVPVNAEDVLRRFAAMPVYTWVYKADERGDRHMGPMAQDFHAVFGLGGDDDRHITTLDADGVMFGAMKGLNDKVERLESENLELRRRLDRIEAGAPRALAGMLPGGPFGFVVIAFGVAGAFLAGRRRAADRSQSDSRSG